jgi:hypothetical protein
MPSAASRHVRRLALHATPPPAFAGTTPEYQVKAALLFKFSRFVCWPPQAFISASTPIVIAVLGRDPFGSDLDTIVSGEYVGGHPLIVRRYHDVSEVDGCHILFIDRSAAARLSEILQALRGRSVLTVSDIDGCAQSGVMIDLVTQDNHIRMQVNVAAARAIGLTISSRVLRCAQIVGPGVD